MFTCRPSEAIAELRDTPTGLLPDIALLRAIDRRLWDMEQRPDDVEEDDLAELIGEVIVRYNQRRKAGDGFGE